MHLYIERNRIIGQEKEVLTNNVEEDIQRCMFLPLFSTPLLYVSFTVHIFDSTALYLICYMKLLHIFLHTNLSSCPLYFLHCCIERNRLIEQEDEVLCATIEEAEVQSSKRYTNNNSISNTMHVLNVHPYQLWTIYNAYEYLVVVMFDVHMFALEKVGQVTWAWVVNHCKHQHNYKAKGKDS